MKKVVNEPHIIFFETLGNKTRWDIVYLLKQRSYRATEIGEKLGYEQSLVSHHLRRLETCGFVSFTQKGNKRVYKLNTKTIKPLLVLMDKHINQFCKKLCR